MGPGSECWGDREGPGHSEGSESLSGTLGGLPYRRLSPLLTEISLPHPLPDTALHEGRWFEREWGRFVGQIFFSDTIGVVSRTTYISTNFSFCLSVCVCVWSICQDFIRAGMTCIKFFIGFSGRSTTITDLFSRRHYLTTALRHFQSARDAKQRAHGDRTPGVGRGRGGGYLRSGSEDPQLSLATSTKNMSVSDLKSHITTIELQMRVRGGGEGRGGEGWKRRNVNTLACIACQRCYVKALNKI